MNRTGLNANKTILMTVVAAIALAVGLWAGASPQTSTATPPTDLIVGLDMSTSQSDPGLYDIANLPAFEACVDVSTSPPQSGIFYVDVFALNATNLFAFSADLEYDGGEMQILESDIKQFFGTGSGVFNYSQNTDQNGIVSPPDTDGAFSAVALDTAGLHNGSGVLARLKAQATIVPGGHVIDFGISTQTDKGVTLTADPGAFHPGDVTGNDGIFDGPFTNPQGKIAVDGPDSDADGVSNTCDNCPSSPNAGQINTDVTVNPPGDSLGDACDSDDDDDGKPDVADNCRTVPNFDQTDTDNDGIGDACEDTDADGIFDGLDNCPGAANPNQEDNEFDGVGDACDPDDDDDGVCDTGGPLPDGTLGTPTGGCTPGPSGADNCPTLFNPGQEDQNANGIGDACEDSDGDLVLDGLDNCPTLANPSQIDADLDGVGNICDNCPNAPNAGQGDWNADFVGDACDWSDNDAWVDAAEITMGTDPNKGCSATTTPNDEAPPDAWPVDFNDDGRAALQDVILGYVTGLAPFGLDQPAVGPLVRMDLNVDGWVTLQDVILGYVASLAPDGLDQACTP